MQSIKTKCIFLKKEAKTQMVNQNHGHVISFKKLFKQLPLGNKKIFQLTPADRNVSKEIRKVSVFWREKKSKDSKLTKYLAWEKKLIHMRNLDTFPQYKA